MDGFFIKDDDFLTFLEWIDMKIEEEIEKDNYEEVIKLKKDKESYKKNIIKIDVNKH